MLREEEAAISAASALSQCSFPSSQRLPVKGRREVPRSGTGGLNFEVQLRSFFQQTDPDVLKCKPVPPRPISSQRHGWNLEHCSRAVCCLRSRRRCQSNNHNNHSQPQHTSHAKAAPPAVPPPRGVAATRRQASRRHLTIYLGSGSLPYQRLSATNGRDPRPWHRTPRSTPASTGNRQWPATDSTSSCETVATQQDDGSRHEPDASCAPRPLGKGAQV